MNQAVSRVTGLTVAVVAVLTLRQVVPSVAAQQISGRGVRPRAAAVDTSLADPEPTRRWREGTVLTDQLGTFEISGDRVVFRPAGQEDSLQVLENLALERVWKLLDEARQRQWYVNGLITEYRGRNYVLIDRAVVRAPLDDPAAAP